MDLGGKVVLITGSWSGIGLKTATHFAEKGSVVIVHGPEESRGLKEALDTVLEDSPESISLACDLTESKAIRAMFRSIEDRYGRLDVLVNNAAAQNPSKFLELSEEDWDRVLSVNLKAPFLCSQLAAGMMIRQGGGKIINVGSVHEYQARRNYAHYSKS